MRLVVILILFCLSFSSTGVAQQTSNLAFAFEYIRQLADNEIYRELAAKEFETEKGDDRFPAVIHGRTRMVLELTSQIRALKRMRLSKPFDYIPDFISTIYSRQIELYNAEIAAAEAFISGPKPGVDYGALVAQENKINAELDYVSKNLLLATGSVHDTLVDHKPDKNGRLSRLIITRAERDKLVQTLNMSFGKKLDEENQNWIVASASALRRNLLKGWKCSDEP